MSAKLEVTHNKSFIQTTAPDKLTSCAKEDGHCSLPKGSGTIYYGANGTYLSASYNTSSNTTSYLCNVTTFGGDPKIGVEKNCYVMQDSQQHQPLTQDQVNAGCVCHA